MPLASYTNSALACARRCLTEFDLRYLQQLERLGDEDAREARDVGSTWHAAHHAGVEDAALAYGAIARHAPSTLWAAKLARLYAAYGWYWQEQPLQVVEAEWQFKVELAGRTFEGQVDGRLVDDSGREGVLERKTTDDGVEAESGYWNRLRLDVQVGIYALAFQQHTGRLPSFIVYDVVRKPTIRPRALAKPEVTRMRRELERTGTATYFTEPFGLEHIGAALDAGREDLNLYGARLTSDIGDRPDFYFARREVARTRSDYQALLRDVTAQVEVLEEAESRQLLHRKLALHRNPDACFTFNRPCDFFALCSNNVRPTGQDPAPEGYRRREHSHPELAP